MHPYQKIVLKPLDWQLPINTADIDPIELANRVRFVANNAIRFHTLDNRDILYRLDEDGKSVHYLSEVRLENNSSTLNQHFATNRYDEACDKLI